jgi:hypothetical protein
MASQTRIEPSSPPSQREWAERPPGRPSHAPAVGRSTGSSRLDALVKALEDIQISDQHDLHRMLEAFRMLGHRLAIEAMMASHELEEGVKAAAKQQSRMGVVGWSARSKIRRTVKAFRNMADSFATAAAGAVTTWNAFEKDFADDLAPTRTKPGRAKGFSINPG